MEVGQKNKIPMAAGRHKKLVLNSLQAEKDKNLHLEARSRLLHLWQKSRSDKAEKDDCENDSI